MPQQTNHSADPRSSASIAHDALKYIAECKLPPTPKVYELWYQYFEGSNQSIRDALSGRVEEPGSLSLELVEALHLQHCSTLSRDEDIRIAEKLADGIVGFKSIVEYQKSVGDSYSKKLDRANQVFETGEPQKVIAAASSLSGDTKAMQQELEKLRQRVVAAEQQVGELQSELSQAQAAMMTDHLTGLGNRRFYESVLRQAVRSVEGGDEGGIPYLALIDCDKFKSINDTFGHPFGDEVIKVVAEELKRVQPDASVARLGGDEFAVFARFDCEEDVAQFADDLHTAVANRTLVAPGSDEALTRLTLSVGIARVRADDNVETWHDRADKMLYKAKNLGGDRAFIEKTLGR